MQDKKVSAHAQREEEILAFWRAAHIFEKSLEKEAPSGTFAFYDGPPFATGKPHYGHIVASVIKDAIPRYKTMRGYRVPRVWGWDCHGLPIENLVEKELGFKHKKDIEEYGIEKFNERCRARVLEYADYWKEFIPRIGRFVDMDHAYYTMDPSFMESVWWVFKQIYDRGFVYEDYRSLHICPRCETTLSQQEVAEGYKEVKDIAVTVKFKVTNPERIGLSGDVYLLAWTTTPWTLPGNVALAVGKGIDYCIATYTEGSHSRTYIYARGAQEKLFGDTDYKEEGECSGEALVGLEYEPPFPYYKKDTTLQNHENGWKVYAADFVTTDTGTGVVHIAPAFGEDDMALGKKENLPFVQHVAPDGTFRPEVTDFAGKEVKPGSDDDRVRLGTDTAIIRFLQEHGAFFAKENIVHSYPHCWRCDTPLLNYATTSWFVSVTKIKDELLKNARNISWSPAHIKEGRFGKWLEGARDWSISRQRFWASAIPLWKDPAGNIIAIGSLDELTRYVRKSGNTYIAMRHGESESNVAGVTNTATVTNDKDHLTDRGREEVRAAATTLKEEGRETIIIASPFTRARETAEILAEEIGVPREAILIDERLREMEVGIFDGKPVQEYDSFFSSYAERFVRAPEGGETLNDLRARAGGLLYDLESRYTNTRIVLVTHARTLWALRAVSRGLLAREAEKVPEPANAEIVPLDFVPLPHNGAYERDLHVPYMDRISLINEAGDPLTRVPDVLDTWFDSGSMPYAQRHYPFENKKSFEHSFPAQFVAEGIDQTRAWFYYLHTLAGALFSSPAFHNAVVNGIVLAEDGKKMSKKLKNYPDPLAVVERHGADALRFYLLSSPVVQAENLSFSEEGVEEIAKKNIGRLTNVLAFYELYADNTPPDTSSSHPLDQWILARLACFIAETTGGYERYELDRAVRPTTAFIDDLSAWYVRRSRERFKGSDESAKKNALATLRFVLREAAKAIAPAMPFIAEFVFQKVREAGDAESVHLAAWPRIPAAFSTKSDSFELPAPLQDLLDDMARVRAYASEALMARQEAGIKVRQPLARLSLPDPLPENLVPILAEEVNVKQVETGASSFSLDTNLSPDLVREGDRRELSRALADARKAEGFSPHDVVYLRVSTGAAPLLEGEELPGVARISFDAPKDAPHRVVLSSGEVHFSLKKYAP